MLVDQHAVVDGELGRHREVDDRIGPEPDHDRVAGALLTVVEHGVQHVALGADLLDAPHGHEVDSPVDEQLLVSLGERGRELRGSERGVGEDEFGLDAVLRERRGDLGADVSAADDDDAPAPFGELAQAPVVLGGAEREDAIIALRRGDRARRRPGREQQAPVADQLPVAGLDGSREAVDAGDQGVQAQLGTRVGDGVQRHLVPREVRIGPQLLRQRRPRVRLIGIGAEDADGAGGVALADAARGRVGDHPAADDQVVVGRDVIAHGYLLRSWRPSRSRPGSSRR